MTKPWPTPQRIRAKSARPWTNLEKATIRRWPTREKKSEDAAGQIGEAKPQDAAQNQDKVLAALDEAIKKAEQDLAAQQNQTDAAAAAEDKLAKIDELKEAMQQELKKDTEAAKPDAAAPLAPKENALAEKAADLAKQDAVLDSLMLPGCGRSDAGQAARTQPLAQAEKAMAQAAKDLADQKPAEASARKKAKAAGGSG